MKHIMLDLETFGVLTGAPILAVGSSMVGVQHPDHPFYAVTKPEGCADFDTIAWWMEQATKNPKAAEEVIKAIREGNPLEATLEQYALWCNRVGRKSEWCIWSKGSTFDIAMVEHKMREFGIEVPWSYQNVMCFRTAQRMFPDVIDPPDSGVAHNALDDSEWQADKLTLIAQRMREANIETII